MDDLSLCFRGPDDATECRDADLNDRLRHLDALHSAAAEVLQVRHCLSRPAAIRGRQQTHDLTHSLLCSQDRNNRQEALTWAIDHVARLPAPSAQHWPRMLCSPLQDGATAHSDSQSVANYALELLRMFCESRPADATAILWRYRIEVGLRLIMGTDGPARYVGMLKIS
jgi:hypothetical protein